MRSDGQATRTRILEAARAEFAESGLAGARVDRIAATACASKERLYAYFGDKRALFEAVLDLNQIEVAEAIPLDAHDLPLFVGRVFDHMISHPQHLRTLTWARLEGVTAGASSDSHHRFELDAIACAQESGAVEDEWAPEDLVAMLFSIAASWVTAPGLFSDPAAPTPAVWQRRRAAAVRAAGRLVEPRPASR